MFTEVENSAPSTVALEWFITEARSSEDQHSAKLPTSGIESDEGNKDALHADGVCKARSCKCLRCLELGRLMDCSKQKLRSEMSQYFLLLLLCFASVTCEIIDWLTFIRLMIESISHHISFMTTAEEVCDCVVEESFVFSKRLRSRHRSGKDCCADRFACQGDDHGWKEDARWVSKQFHTIE